MEKERLKKMRAEYQEKTKQNVAEEYTGEPFLTSGAS